MSVKRTATVKIYGAGSALLAERKELGLKVEKGMWEEMKGHHKMMAM